MLDRSCAGGDGLAAAPACRRGTGFAQPAAAQQAAPGPAVPGFWDPRRRPERPDTSRITLIRFLTETDYPPFNYAGADGNPTGFNIDLARAICDELKISLHDPDAPLRHAAAGARRKSRRRADRLDRGDAGDAQARRFQRSVLSRAGALRGRGATARCGDCGRRLLEGKKVAVVAGTAHEAYLKALFTEVELQALSDAGGRARGAAPRRSRPAFRRRDLAVILDQRHGFGGCCAFSGGPFFDSRFFGEGVGVAVRRGNDTLRQAVNWALFRLWEKGRFTDLWLRYFPISPF